MFIIVFTLLFSVIIEALGRSGIVTDTDDYISKGLGTRMQHVLCQIAFVSVQMILDSAVK